MTMEESLQNLTSEMRLGFSQIGARLDTMDAKFDAIDRRFDAMDRRFDSTDRRFDAVDRRLDAMDARFDAMEIRLDTSFKHIGELIIKIDAHVAILANAIAAIERRVLRIENQLPDTG